MVSFRNNQQDSFQQFLYIFTWEYKTVYTILHIFADFTGISHPLVLGFVELTQGVTALPATPSGFVMAAALLGWGGLSVHCQTAAVLAGTDLSLKNHLLGKSCQALLSVLLAVLLLPLLW